jgi:sodium transport system permease protein
VNWEAVRILYLHELRSALRERTIVVNSILMPIFLYPVILWVMFSAITFIQGVNEGFTSRVALVTPAPEGHEELVDSLAAAPGVRLALGDGTIPELPPLEGEDGEPAPPPPVEVMDRGAALDLLARGELDAVVGFAAPEGGASELPLNFQVEVSWDRAENRSGGARERIEAVVDDYRRRWTEREAEALGLAPADRVRFQVVSENVASSEDLGAMLLGQMVSFFLIIMVALGCFTPAVDTTAGERERSTWETLMTVAAPRSAVILAKYLYVATLGIVAATLNVVALFVSIGAIIEPLLASSGGGPGDFSFTLHAAAIPVMLAGAVSLALFFAAAMMILAAFARTFKDGQAMIQPVYFMVFLPFLLGQGSDMTLTPAIASIPVANVSMMIRDAMNGVFIWPLIAQTLAVTLGTVVLCLVAARYILRFEDFLMGSFDGSFWRFVKDRLVGGRKKPA